LLTKNLSGESLISLPLSSRTAIYRGNFSFSRIALSRTLTKGTGNGDFYVLLTDCS